MLARDKASIRTELLAFRRRLDDVRTRSDRIADGLDRLLGAHEVRVVVAYEACPGEPDLEPWIETCRARGIEVRVPGVARDAEPPVVHDADLVVVPGVAFTRRGDRLGRGAGWYDRVLASVPPRATIVGVCFVEQLVDRLPVEAHDVAMHVVVTDATEVTETLGEPSPADSLGRGGAEPVGEP